MVDEQMVMKSIFNRTVKKISKVRYVLKATIKACQYHSTYQYIMCLPIPGSSKCSCEPVFLFIQYIEHTKPKCTHPVPTFPHSATFLQREYFTQCSKRHVVT